MLTLLRNVGMLISKDLNFKTFSGDDVPGGAGNRGIQGMGLEDTLLAAPSVLELPSLKSFIRPRLLSISTKFKFIVHKIQDDHL